MKPTQSLAQVAQKKPFSVMIQSEGYKNLINNTLRDPKKAANFVTAVTSAVSVNPSLQECDPGTILSSALLGESLNLSPSPQLGMYYIVPYKDRKSGRTVGSFQIGYRGYIQLAIRSGYYKKINVLAIKEGELVKYDPINDDIIVNLIDDEDVRDAAPTMGYYAGLEYMNGFKKILYWSKTKMINHADRYSKAFNKATYQRLMNGQISKDDYSVSSYWYKDFDGMAMKTMLRQLISKWGIMSTELQTAYHYDEGTPVMSGSEFVDVDYVDNDGVEANAAYKNEVVDEVAAEPKQEPVKAADVPVEPEIIPAPEPAPAPAPAKRGRPPKHDDFVAVGEVSGTLFENTIPNALDEDDPLL